MKDLRFLIKGVGIAITANLVLYILLRVDLSLIEGILYACLAAQAAMAFAGGIEVREKRSFIVLGWLLVAMISASLSGSMLYTLTKSPYFEEVTLRVGAYAEIGTTLALIFSAAGYKKKAYRNKR